jgi:hypothetical protein
VVVNASYDGSADTALLAGGSTLGVSATAQVRVTVTVDLLTDPGSGLGVYDNQASLTATGPGTAETTDLSDAGTDPDPDGDGEPNEAGENDPTPFTVLEQVPPQVVTVDSIPATSGGLTECENAKVPITQLIVTFDEDMNDPAGDTDIDDVTNPANYALVAAGSDREIATMGCGPVSGDDVVISVDGVTYAAGTFTSTLAIHGGVPLADEAYRLFACSELTDLAGNNLDGNSDGTEGDDFIRGFRLDVQNEFDNGNLDCDLGSWDLASSPAPIDPSEIAFDALDADASTISGSARAFAVGAGRTLSLTQCFTTDSRAFDLSGFARIETATVSATVLCRFYDAAACAGTLLGAGGAGSVSVEKGSAIGVFEGVGMLLLAPPGSLSARCGVEVTDGVAAAEAFADRLHLELGIFADGFESGDTSAWSATLP